MNRTIHATHSKESFLFVISKIFERASYYGIRVSIIFYLMSEVFQMEAPQALSIYGWFAFILIFSRILGATLGDLLIGNKNTIIAGGVIQSLGAFILCFPSLTGLYIGLSLIVLGGGLYNPNVTSNFGRLYLNKIKLLDAAYALFLLGTNIGSFIGIALIGYIGEAFGWTSSFIICGIMMLLSVIPILLTEKEKVEIEKDEKLTINSRILTIVIAFIAVSLFWVAYELGSVRISDIESQIGEISSLPVTVSSSFNSMFTIPVSILMVFLWSYFYSSQFFKLTVGFISGAISLGILYLMPEVFDNQYLVFFLISLLFLSISETYISPVLYSVLTKYTNPKYLAIVISLSYIPIRLFSWIVALFKLDSLDSSLLIALVMMIILSIGLMIYLKIKKEIQ